MIGRAALWNVVFLASGALPTSALLSQQADTISAGHRQFARAPRIGVDTLDGYAVVGDSSQRTYTMTRSTTLTPDGHVLLETRFGGVSYFSRIKLAPLTSVAYRAVSNRDSAAVNFAGEYVDGWVVPGPDKSRERIEHEFGDDIVPFDPGAREILAQLLPLADAYSAVFRLFDPYQNKGEWWSLTVVGSETMTYRGHPVDCWVIETTIPGSATAPTHRQWISKDTRLLLQDRNMRPLPNGRTMIARAR